MSHPSTRELESVIVDILSTARDDGRLSQLTVRIVRQKLATHFDIDEDVLEGETYKSFIKATVHATVNSLQSVSHERTAPPQCNAVEMENVNDATKTGSHKPRAKVQPRASDEASQEDAKTSGREVPPPKKAPSRSKSSNKPAKSSVVSKKPESELKFKSKAIIESSDEEAVPKSDTQKSRSQKMEPLSAGSKQKQQRKANKVDSDIQMGPVEGPVPSGSSFKPKDVTKSPKTSVSKAKESTEDPMESELSSVIDEPPKKRQKKQEKESAKAQKDEKEKTKRGKKKEVLSKDEEMVNKLKGIVVACGVRKVWKKEFEGLDKSSQQIKRLHTILGDLGMTPRYSLEKAKAIREERELAQELKDVQDFEKATKKRGKAPRSSSETEESPDQGDSDVNIPTRKKANARASIMAFLQDQSEED